MSCSQCFLSRRAPVSSSSSPLTQAMVDGLAALAVAPRPAVMATEDTWVEWYPSAVPHVEDVLSKCAARCSTSCSLCWANMPVHYMYLSSRCPNIARARHVQKDLERS